MHTVCSTAAVHFISQLVHLCTFITHSPWCASQKIHNKLHCIASYFSMRWDSALKMSKWKHVDKTMFCKNLWPRIDFNYFSWAKKTWILQNMKKCTEIYLTILHYALRLQCWLRELFGLVSLCRCSLLHHKDRNCQALYFDYCIISI